MLRDQIAELEADIEDLSQAAERCRKIGIAAQVLMAGGAFLLMLAVLGLWRRDRLLSWRLWLPSSAGLRSMDRTSGPETTPWRRSGRRRRIGLR